MRVRKTSQNWRKRENQLVGTIRFDTFTNPPNIKPSENSLHLNLNRPSMALRIIWMTLFFWPSLVLVAQPGNDNCSGIIDLGDIPICPVIGTFTNVDATGSVVFTDPTLEQPTCWNGGAPDADVWFSFNVPVGSPILDVFIEVNGVPGTNGSILQPQLAVYRGDCELDGLEELACAVSGTGATDVELEILGLTPGFTYYMRIDDWSATAADNWGDFELCISEPLQVFNIGEEPGSGACSGTLFDSGGPDGNYQNNETYTFVICPDELTNCIDLNIVSTSIETNFDNLTIFDGDNTSGAQLWNFTGSGGAVNLQAGTDCITVLFDSDISITQAGFELNWECSSTPCATTLFPCEETQPIFGLPFAANNQTTCGSGDDVNDGPCGDGSSVLAGEDVVYTYFTPGNECIRIEATGVDLNTGLSVYNDCPESATDCLGFTQNMSGDSVVIQNLALESAGTIYIVLSNANCTDYDLSITSVACLQIADGPADCNDAFLLNSCSDPQELFSIPAIASTNPDYFQVGINDGCWSDLGAGHLTWLQFQAQADGDFGFLVNLSDPSENPNIDIQVWGPITDADMICDFMANNQPVRSTGAAPNAGNLTGLIDTNPLTNDPVTDDCESTAGDGFVSLLSVTNESFYVILLNDHSGNMQNGWLELDFSATSPGVLDGLPAGSSLAFDPYTTVGTAFYNPMGADYSCIQITNAQNSQLGCAWQSELVDFSQPFTNEVTVYFGNNDGGADGLCMVYHLDPAGDSACGVLGGEIGAGTIQNSLIIEFDTWQNGQFGDPFQDHISVNVNGDMGSAISAPVPMPNLEDGQEHEVIFTWDPATMTYEIFFDGALIISDMYDVIANCFGGETMVYGGYTGSTGGASNLQYVCTGEDVFPASTLDTVLVELCEGESYFTGGADQTTPGFYSDVFVAFNGCDSTIVTDLQFFPEYGDTIVVELCEGESYFAGGADQTTTGFYVDMYQTSLGCDSMITTDLRVFPAYDEAVEVVLCAGESYFVGGADQTTDGIYFDTLLSVQGCDSIIQTDLQFLQLEVSINTPDPLTCENPECVGIVAVLSATLGPITFEWTAAGSGVIQDGQGTLEPTVCGPDIYTLFVEQFQGTTVCTEEISVEVVTDFTGDCLEYEFPTAFTPNGDGVNDVFQVVADETAVQVLSLAVYNRWGQLVHEGAGVTHGWDGMIDGEPAPMEVYAYMAKVQIGVTGEIIDESGEVSVVR
jgi:gliding motility-associated-like protein